MQKPGITKPDWSDRLIIPQLLVTWTNFYERLSFKIWDALLAALAIAEP